MKLIVFISLSIFCTQLVFAFAPPINPLNSSLIIGASTSGQLGYCVSTAGDVNGDGYNDIIAGEPYFQNGEVKEGAARLYYGTANGIQTSPAWICEGNHNIAIFSSGYGNSMGFGTSVSDAGDVNGDGYADVIVGSPYFSNGQKGEGKAFVYLGSATGLAASPAWAYEPNIDSARFGFCVSSAGDVNGDGYSDIVVGSPTETNGQVKEGRSYVFYGSSTGPSLSPDVILEENNANSLLGWSVSSAGDINSDGFSDLIVSAAYYTNGSDREGKVFLYEGGVGGLSPVAAWSYESNFSGAYFGESISWAGDVNGDGFGDVIIGADRSNGFWHPNLGRAYVFHGSSTGLSTLTIMLSGTFHNGFFGVGVSGAGDVNGDGFADVVIGANGLMNPSFREGAIYIYYGSQSGISPTLYTLIESNLPNTELGISVCSAGDVNGDGFSEVIAGAYLFDKTTAPAASNAGAFYVYYGSPENIGNKPLPSTPFTALQSEAATGNFVTTVGDVNGDGFSDMAVGASNYDNSIVNTGMVYVFNGSQEGYSSSPSAVLTGPPNANAFFGCSIGAAGDVNGDGFSDVIVGASGYNSGPTASEGAAFIYLGTSTGINTNYFLKLEGNSTNAQFGFSVAGAGDVNGDGYSDVIVGAKTYNGGTANEGKAFVYYGASTGTASTPAWQYETNIAEEFGTGVAGVGDCNGDGFSDVVVVASKWSNGQLNEGRLFYFRGSSSGLETTPGAIAETNCANSLLNNQSTGFIGDVNGDGFNDVCLGVRSFNNASTPNEGALMLFYGNATGINSVSPVFIQGNSTNSYVGSVIGFGGDFNNDGYHDIISGSPQYTNGHTGEGCLRVYAGSSAGLNPAPYFTYEPNKASVMCGASICAGDANGDGYSDLIAGLPGYDSAGIMNCGTAMILHGNNAHGVLPLSSLTKQYKSNLTTIVQTSNSTFEPGCVFGTGHFEKSSMGRIHGKLAYEFRGHPDPFSVAGSSMAKSVMYSGIQPAHTDLGINGTELKVSVSAAGMGFPKWRTRVKFKLTEALDGQVYGRWFYQGIHDKQDRSIKIDNDCGLLPIELVSTNVICNSERNGLEWEMANESGIEWYAVYVSENGTNYNLIGTIMPQGETHYYHELASTTNINYVKLEIKGSDGAMKAVTLGYTGCNGLETSLLLYPNPVNETLNFRLISVDEVPVSITVLDLAGKQISTIDPAQNSINVSGFSTGMYQLCVCMPSGLKYLGKFNRL
ncbi:MAG TPA: FG-GAP-like repeat-containing protein [Flavobacteriales bacterium]|nr:FG-GAP-like repeat-containing protein [Flavobacteriales bacterium]